MINKQDVEKAYSKIHEYIVNTPVRRSHVLSGMCNCDMLLKMENLQMSGAFKERGALNRLLKLSPEEKKCGVIAASAGNHAQGVAYHAKRMGIRARIVMPEGTPLIKVMGVQSWDADVILKGETYDDAYEYSLELEKEEGAIFIHPFADIHVIAGQGTIGMEVLQDNLCKDIDAIVVPVGGGGLIAGIGAYVKKVNPKIKIIGVEVEGLDCMRASLAKGEIQDVVGKGTIADGIAVKRVSPLTLEMAQRYVDEIVTVNDDEICNAILLLLEIEKIVVEGAGAVAIAALLNKKIPALEGKKVVSIISGGNIDVNILSRIIDRGLDFGGRIAQMSTMLKDKPGALEEVIAVFHKENANILEVYQHRYCGGAPVGDVKVSFTIETKNRLHIKDIQRQLEKHGYEVTHTQHKND
ncbi:MAG: threonine ammonia-lyase [Phycisphaerae bacterium]|nr:threonine ammonia-lyase [Phycisphaerae bacterium]